jgi:sugar lactone lactonase YvrE
MGKPKHTFFMVIHNEYFRRLFAEGNNIWVIQSMLLLQHDTFVFFSSGDFKVPICVAAAANGNLYVTAKKSNNLHCFTPDGKHKGIMLKKEHGLNNPYVIAFSKKSSKVFIVNYHEKSVLRFSHYCLFYSIKLVIVCITTI